jgi:hypothetical protein
MAQRRERPAQQQGGKGFDFRLSDGRTISIPVTETRDPVTGDVCCFCGEGFEEEPVSIEARWVEADRERSQSWSAHRACLAERMHERVRGTGPLFGA